MSSEGVVTLGDVVSGFGEISGVTSAAITAAEACGRAYGTHAEVLGKICEEVEAWRTHLIEVVDPPVAVAAAEAAAATRRPRVGGDAAEPWNTLTSQAVAALAGAEESVDVVMAWGQAARAGYDTAVAQANEVKGRLASLGDEAKERAEEGKASGVGDDLRAAVVRVRGIIAWLEPWIEAAAADQPAIDAHRRQLVESTAGGDASRFQDLRVAVEAVEAALRSTSAVAEAFSRTVETAARE